MEPIKHYVMVIDLRLCIGCDTCSVACKQENNLPEGVWWTRVIRVNMDGANGADDGHSERKLEHLPLGCQHCANGPCVEVCPTSATYRTSDGLVMQDPSLCIGCRYCTIVCPFTGVRVYASEQPTYALPFPTGDNPMVHRARTTEKCTFCTHRLEQGKLPACIDACPLKARTFGDLNDPDSEVSRLLHERPHFRLLVEKGTEPSVYYLT
jgi:molybdopterin-containing oxidoreductase family iron-sulfur binding subunit